MLANRMMMGAAGVGVNVYDANTMLMLHMDGSDGSTNFVDSTYQHTITAIADAQIDTAATDAFGGHAGVGLFDGTGDCLSVPTSVQFDFGTGNWTFDFRFNTDTVAAGVNDGLFTIEAGTETTLSTWVSTDKIVVKVNNVELYITISASTWYHLAIVRNGNTVTAYLGGTADATTWDVTGISFNDNNAGMHIAGYATAGTYVLDGMLDEFRVSNIARWTSNFTPPSSPYTS